MRSIFIFLSIFVLFPSASFSAQIYAGPAGAPTPSNSATPCKICSGNEMNDIDPSRLLGDPGKSNVQPLKAIAAKKRPAKRRFHKHVAQHNAVRRTASRYATKKKSVVAHHVSKPPSVCDA